MFVLRFEFQFSFWNDGLVFLQDGELQEIEDANSCLSVSICVVNVFFAILRRKAFVSDIVNKNVGGSNV